MTIVLIVTVFVLCLYLLSIWEVRTKAKKNNIKLGFWETLWRGVTNIFSHLSASVPLDF